MRRKLGLHKKEAMRPGALLEKSRSMIGKPIKKHKMAKKEISFKHYKKDEPLKNPDTEHGDKEPDFKKRKEMPSQLESEKNGNEPEFKKHKIACKHCKSMKHKTSEHHMKSGFKKHKMPKTFGGKSTKPGMGGRSKILEAKGVPKGVIGAIARSKGMAPGQPKFHGGK